MVEYGIKSGRILHYFLRPETCEVTPRGNMSLIPPSPKSLHEHLKLSVPSLSNHGEADEAGPGAQYGVYHAGDIPPVIERYE
jgi:hypothetical protein